MILVNNRIRITNHRELPNCCGMMGPVDCIDTSWFCQYRDHYSYPLSTNVEVLQELEVNPGTRSLPPLENSAKPPLHG